jgi:hypothetical protein
MPKYHRMMRHAGAVIAIGVATILATPSNAAAFEDQEGSGGYCVNACSEMNIYCLGYTLGSTCEYSGCITNITKTWYPYYVHCGYAE